jgi:hypothetical protein
MYAVVPLGFFGSITPHRSSRSLRSPPQENGPLNGYVTVNTEDSRVRFVIFLSANLAMEPASNLKVVYINN